MVIGLQLPLQSLPLDGSLGKHQQVNPELIQPLSFGELLKLKEKQLQLEQLVSAASIAAALATLQIQSITIPLPIQDVEAVEIKPTMDGSAQPTAGDAGSSNSSLAAQQATARFITTVSSDLVAQAFSNTQTGVAPGQSESSPAITSTTAEIENNTTTTITKPVAADGSANLSVTQPASDQVTAHVNKSVQPTSAESPAYSAASVRMTRPTVNPTQPKFEMQPQEVGTYSLPQAAGVDTRPVSDTTPSIATRPDRVDIPATSVPASTESVPTPALTAQPNTAFVHPQNENSAPVEDKQRTVNIQVQNETASVVARTSSQPEIAQSQAVRSVEIHTPVVAAQPTEAQINASVLVETTVENTEDDTVSIDETAKLQPRVTIGEQQQRSSGNSSIQEKTFAKNTLENDDAVKPQNVQPQADESARTTSTSAKNVPQPIRNEIGDDVPVVATKTSFASKESVLSPVSNSQPNAALVQDDAASETVKQASMMDKQSVTKDFEPQIISTAEGMPEPVVSKPLDDSRMDLTSDKRVQATDNTVTAPVAQDDVVNEVIPGVASDVEQTPVKPLDTTEPHSESLPRTVGSESMIRDGGDGEQLVATRTIMTESEVAPVEQKVSRKPADLATVDVMDTSKTEVKTDVAFTAVRPVASQTAHSEVRVDVVTQSIKETAESIKGPVSKQAQSTTNVAHEARKSDVPAAPTESSAGIRSEIRHGEQVVHDVKADAQVSISQTSPAVSKPKVDFDVERSTAADVSQADKPLHAPTTSNENTSPELKAGEDAAVIEKRSAASKAAAPVEKTAAPTPFDTLSDEIYQPAQKLTDDFVPQASEKMSWNVDTNEVTFTPKTATSTSTPNVEHIIAEPVVIDVDRTTTPSHDIDQAAQKLMGDLGKPVNEHVLVDVPTFDEPSGLAPIESDATAKVESMEAETVSADVAQVETPPNETQPSAQKLTRDAVGQVSEKTLPDMNIVEATSVSEQVETASDEELQPVQTSAQMLHDSGKVMSDVEVVEETPIAEKAAASITANTNVVAETPVMVRSAARQPVVNTTMNSDEPAVHDPAMTATESAARSSDELTADVQDEFSTMQPLHDAPTVEARKVDMDRKETVDTFIPVEIKAETVQENVALEHGNLEAKPVTARSTTAPATLDDSADVAVKVDAKPVTSLEQEFVQAALVTDKEPDAVKPNEAHEQPVSQGPQMKANTALEGDMPTAYSDKADAVEIQTQRTVEVSKPVSHSAATETRPAEIAPHTVASKVQETPIQADTTSMAVKQVVAEPVHVNDDPVNAKAVDQRFINVEQKEEAAPKAETYEPVIGETPVSTRPIAQVQPNEEIKVPQRISKDEETRPAEKRTELNQTPISTVSANGPVNEAKAADFNGKISVGQFQAQAAEVAEQVIRQMRSNLKTGTTSMHLQLNPQELGAIEVDMVSTAQGVQVTFFAEQASTGRLLETQLNQLRDSLVDSGVQLSGLNIGQHNTHGQKGGTFSQDPNFAPLPHEIFVEEHQASATGTPVPERSVGQSGEVDYRI